MNKRCTQKRDVGRYGVRRYDKSRVRLRTPEKVKAYGPAIISHFRVRTYARTRVCRGLI